MERSFDDPSTPLHEVTFCVLDLETTGTSPYLDTITEVGAVKVRGGDRLGTFQTLVHPDSVIPSMITALTGISDAMVAGAPPICGVLPMLAEFVGGAVLVGHNVGFDWSFLDAALLTQERAPLGLRRVDTVMLARRLVGDEVRDCKLATLAHHLHLAHQPTHRALSDVEATVELLHVLLERAAAFGVTQLDDLLLLPRVAAHPQVAKLHLTNQLPRGPGVYVVRDRQGDALFVGRARDVRARVRSYFAGEDRRRLGPVLRAAHTIDHVACAGDDEAAAVESRLLQELTPRYNRRPRRRRPAEPVTSETVTSETVTTLVGERR